MLSAPDRRNDGLVDALVKLEPVRVSNG